MDRAAKDGILEFPEKRCQLRSFVGTLRFSDPPFQEEYHRTGNVLVLIGFDPPIIMPTTLS